eukprot:5376999-Lingulodinium_polyedra.AAC.1
MIRRSSKFKNIETASGGNCAANSIGSCPTLGTESRLASQEARRITSPAPYGRQSPRNALLASL